LKLKRPHDRWPGVMHDWADQSYSGDLVEWAAKDLGITAVAGGISKRPLNFVGAGGYNERPNS